MKKYKWKKNNISFAVIFDFSPTFCHYDSVLFYKASLLYIVVDVQGKFSGDAKKLTFIGYI